MNDKKTLSTNAKEPGFWRELWQQARLVFYLLSDSEVPFYLKILPFLTLVYLLLPVDLLVDFVPVVGQLDDITILLIGSKIFIELAPPSVVARHLAAIRERDGFAPFVEDRNADSAEPVKDDVADAIIINGQHEIISGQKNKKDRV